MPIATIEPKRLYRQIADQLLSLIDKGEFSVGKRLPSERDLAIQLGVSRPSVREALIALEVGEIIEVRMGSGIYVLERKKQHNYSQIDIEWGPLELLRAREIIESEVAFLAAQNATNSDIKSIDTALKEMKKQAKSESIPRQGDEDFHIAIANACGNEVLRDTVHSYWKAQSGHLFRRFTQYFENPPSWDAAMLEHELIFKTIREKRPGAAKLAMQKHLKKAHQRYSASWRRAKLT